MTAILALPLLLILTGLSALAMFVPALHGYLENNYPAARAFLYAGVVTLLVTAMVAVAVSNHRPRNVPRRHLTMLAGAYLLLPLVHALPFSQALADTTFANAWFEMVSCFTTTGATVYDTPGRLPATLHLWRGIVGWLGGLFVLISAAAILAPMDLGGAEVISGRVPGRGVLGGAQITRLADPTQRLIRQTILILPAYAGLTLLVWVGLLTTAEPGLSALMLAMAAVSTSGIVMGTGTVPSGFAVEAMVFVAMLTTLTRRSLPGGILVDRSRGILADHEVRLAAFFLLAVPAILFLRHWAGALDVDAVADWAAAGRALWGALFTTLSFLTTTGLESASWQAARAWSGLGTPGLILLGLAMVGGGIATTAGGLKLLRVYALIRHGERELDRLVHPSSIGGGGPAARRLRNEGAYAAWIFFMLFALTLAIGVGALALERVAFEPALVLTIAALTTTGQLAALATEVPIRYDELSTTVKAVLGVLMVLGRVEVLAILALIAPGAWRR